MGQAVRDLVALAEPAIGRKFDPDRMSEGSFV